MNVSVERRLRAYGGRLDGAIASYLDRSDDRVVPASLVEPPASEHHSGARRRSAALATGAIAITIVAGTTILATRRTPAHPTLQTSAATTTTIGPHTIDGETFGPMPYFGLHGPTVADYPLIPDYLGVASRDGRGVAGYIKKTDFVHISHGRILLGGDGMNVYADGGHPLIGHFYQCKGFVALSENPVHVANRCLPRTVITR
jgi:hypothetical protein